MAKKEKEKNVVVIRSTQEFLHYEHWFWQIRKLGHDEIVLTTRHCRPALEQLVDRFTKDVKASREVERFTDKQGRLWVKLQYIGALL